MNHKKIERHCHSQSHFHYMSKAGIEQPCYKRKYKPEMLEIKIAHKPLSTQHHQRGSRLWVSAREPVGPDAGPLPPGTWNPGRNWNGSGAGWTGGYWVQWWVGAVGGSVRCRWTWCRCCCPVGSVAAGSCSSRFSGVETMTVSLLSFSTSYLKWVK